MRGLKDRREKLARKDLSARLARRVKTAQTVLMASHHPSVIMAIGISVRLTLENLRAEKRAILDPQAFQALLAQRENRVFKVPKVIRAKREMRSLTLISPLNSWLLSKVKKVTKATPERRVPRVIPEPPDPRARRGRPDPRAQRAQRVTRETPLPMRTLPKRSWKG